MIFDYARRDVVTGGSGMKRGFRVMDSDLHVIETDAVYERYLDARYRDTGPRYLGWSPTNFPHWEVQGRMIPPCGLGRRHRAAEAPR